MNIRTLTTLGAIALLFAAGPVFAQRGGRGGVGLPQNLSFRFIGPAVGNRIAAASGVMGDLNTLTSQSTH